MENNNTKIADIGEISHVDSVMLSDVMQIVKIDDSGMALSYKSELSSFGNVLILKKTISECLDKIDKISSNLSSLINSYVTKSEIDSTYCKRLTFENRTAKLLTISNMDSILEKYPKKADIDEKYSSAREYTFKLAEEFTDFIAAAEIGIAQGIQESDGGNPDENPDE